MSTRKSTRISKRPKPIYEPDMAFIQKVYFDVRDIVEDEKMTELLGSSDAVPSDCSSDIEEERQLDEKYLKKGLDPNKYLTKNKKMKSHHLENDEEYEPSASSSNDESEQDYSDEGSTSSISEEEEDDEFSESSLIDDDDDNESEED